MWTSLFFLFFFYFLHDRAISTAKHLKGNCKVSLSYFSVGDGGVLGVFGTTSFTYFLCDSACFGKRRGYFCRGDQVGFFFYVSAISAGDAGGTTTSETWCTWAPWSPLKPRAETSAPHLYIRGYYNGKLRSQRDGRGG